MSNLTSKTKSADLGDYLKVAACTAVILQSVLTLALKQPISPTLQRGLTLIDNGLKFTAPAFIFGILFTTTQTCFPSDLRAYPRYLKRQWSALFLPAICWTTLYLLVMPAQQQKAAYHNLPTFIWQFINGNAAPHLWYNTMMLQFIVCMPVFWWLARWASNRTRVNLLLILTLVGTVVWVSFYDQNVWHGPHQQSWYLLDRLGLSFGVYGILGTLMAKFTQPVVVTLTRARGWLILVWGLMLMFITLTLVHEKQPVDTQAVPYIHPAMIGYDLTIIALICIWANRQLKCHARNVPVIHFLATYAYWAYLANVFWLQLIWAFTHHWFKSVPVIVIVLSYLFTWSCAFAGAYGFISLNGNSSRTIVNMIKIGQLLKWRLR